MKKITALSLLGAVLAGVGFTGCNKNAADEVLAKVDLVPVQTSKEKWSFVDPSGKIIMEDEFKSMPSLAYNGFFSVERNDKYVVFKVDGEKSSELGDLVGLKSVGYFEDGLIPVTFPKERISVYDTKGKKKFEITPISGQEVVSTDPGYSEGLLKVELEDGKEGYIDKTGNVVIKAQYDMASTFTEGLAVVGVNNEDKDEMIYSVIDTKGKTVFKLKEGQNPRGGYINGYMIVNDGDRDVLYNKKGEATKFPSKIHRITSTDGKYVIFENDDNETGVCDMEGEVIVRAKYSHVLFNGSDGFVAWDDDESLILDNKGEQKAKLDYKNAFPMGQFGYFAQDGSRYSQIDKEGKPICKTDFYAVNIYGQSASYTVRSDFFDTAGAAKALADLVNGKKVGDYTFGSSPSKVVSGSPNSYTYTNEVTLEGLEKKGYRYEITGRGLFNSYMADSSWDYYDYSWNYYWNSNAQLSAIRLNLSAQTEWGKAGFDALVSAFKAKGFTMVKEGVDGNDNEALMTKGTVFVVIECGNEGYTGTVVVADKSIEGMDEAYNRFEKSITKSNGSSRDAAEAMAAEEANTEAVVEVVEETPAAW